jgi:ketosteroid isomerase-like protein
VELIKKWVQAYENEDIAALREMYSTELVSIGPQYNQEWPYDTLNSTASWFEEIDSMKIEVITMLPETVKEGDLAGDWVLVWADISWYDVKAEKSVKIMWHSPMRIKEGKIVYEVAYWNQWDLFKQLGAKLEWPDDDEGEKED